MSEASGAREVTGAPPPKDAVRTPLTRSEAVAQLTAIDSASGGDPSVKEHRYVTNGKDVFVDGTSRDDMPEPEKDMIQHSHMADLVVAARAGDTEPLDREKFEGGYLINDGSGELIPWGPSNSIPAFDSGDFEQLVNEGDPKREFIYIIDPRAMQKAQAGQAAQ